MLESIFVIILFILYLALWKIKKINQIKNTGKNPQVIAKSADGIQKYMNIIFKILTVYVFLLIIFHSSGYQLESLFTRYNLLDTFNFDILGFLLGLSGLLLCLYAQVKMGSSWRVGIDEKEKTELITTGLYRCIRNPTYLGLFILNAGVWLIWPTWTVFVFILVFFLMMEIQVRCEEEHLHSIHGDKYVNYKKKTKRYLPYLY